MKINVLEMIDKLRAETLAKYENEYIVGTLAIIQVGDNPASNLYVKSKKVELAKWKISVEHHQFSENTDQDDIIDIIYELNHNDKVNGIIVQLPLPAHYNTQEVLNAISFRKNVDGFKQYHKDLLFTPCTPQGIMYIIEQLRDIEGKTICLVGRGKTIGEPLIEMLSKQPCTLICCNSHTTNLAECLSVADVVISAVGQPKLFNSFNLKYDALVIDAGISYINGKQTGDYDHHEALNKNIDYTPHLNGVGKMTCCMLAVNVIKAVELQRG